MSNSIMYVGVDVDDAAFHGCGYEDKHFYEFSCRPTAKKLIEKIKKFEVMGYEVRTCYEAGYLGNSLCRELRAEGYDCQVVATSLVPRRPGFLQKTDRLDSRKLAEFYASGLLTMVELPTEEDEQTRDLIRSRQFLRDQRKSLRAHILCMCRRLGWHYRLERKQTGSKHWTQRHRVWLRSKINELNSKVTKDNLESLLSILAST